MAQQISPRNYYQRIGPRKAFCLIWIHPAVSRPRYAFFSVLQLTVISFRRGLPLPKLGFGIDSCDFSQRLFHVTNTSRSSRQINTAVDERRTRSADIISWTVQSTSTPYFILG